MKTKAENRRLFVEARKLRENIKTCLHDRAKNNREGIKVSCSIKHSDTVKEHKK